MIVLRQGLHARTEMLFAASRGDWQRAEDYAVNLLAQKEGDDLCVENY